MGRRAILVWVISTAAVAVRCSHIAAPFVDQWSWRQCDVAAIARNYSENGYRFSFPQIDWAGDQPGFVGTEFPILPFAAAVAYKFTGVQEWIGRLESILFFGLSLPLVYYITTRAVDYSAALAALLFYGFAPLAIATGRAFMPDMPSLTLALGALLFFWRWMDRCTLETSIRQGRANVARLAHWDGLAAAVMLALSLLLKPTMLTMGVPIGYLAFRQFGFSAAWRVELWLFGAIGLLPSIAWYWHAHELAQRFYPHHFFGAGGVKVMSPGWYWRIIAQTFTSTLTPVVSLLALAGLWMLRRDERAAPLRWWAVAIAVFIVLAGYGNRHQWYQLPIVPVAAAFAGAGLSWFARHQRSRATVPVIIVAFLALSTFYAARFFAPTTSALWRLGVCLREQTPPNALVVIADDGDPTALYYAHRKGWHFLERHGIYNGNPADTAQIMHDLQKLRTRGATHLAFYKATFWWLDYYPKLTERLSDTGKTLRASTEYRIYQLNTE